VRNFCILSLFVLSAMLQACVGLSGKGEASRPAPLVVVSIDGFRADYLDRGITPNLSHLAASGAKGTMRPSFPSATFPNHYTLVTGLIPDHHGMVANNMFDPTHPGAATDPSAASFTKAKDSDGFWWKDAVPVWVTAQQSGLRAGLVFWPGAKAEIGGMRPTYARPWEKGAASRDRVERLLELADLPAEQRPDLYLLYLDEVDEAGHNFGPDAAQTTGAVVNADTAIGELMRGLKARGIDANIVVVSDHGMSAVAPERTTYISDLLGKEALPSDAQRDPRYQLIYWGAFAMLNPAPGSEALIDDRLVNARLDHMQCWHKGDIPRRLKFGRHPRVPEILCLPEAGWQVGGVRGIGDDLGNHGYDPQSPDMAAIFIASGPGIRTGVTLPVFDNVDVYSLETRLLRLKPERGDGSLTALTPALK
jgi:predicted AlkP superfamily pyrophosphatase or phosphodiesterase